MIRAEFDSRYGRQPPFVHRNRSFVAVRCEPSHPLTGAWAEMLAATWCDIHGHFVFR